MTEPRVSLHRACRVRKERFGLLFYDSRGPRLLFAETGDLLEPGFFTGELSVDDTLDKLMLLGVELLMEELVDFMTVDEDDREDIEL